MEARGRDNVGRSVVDMGGGVTVAFGLERWGDEGTEALLDSREEWPPGMPEEVEDAPTELVDIASSGAEGWRWGIPELECDEICGESGEEEGDAEGFFNTTEKTGAGTLRGDVGIDISSAAKGGLFRELEDGPRRGNAFGLVSEAMTVISSGDRGEAGADEEGE